MIARLPGSLLDLSLRALPHQEVIHPLRSYCRLFGPGSRIGCVDAIPLRVLLTIPSLLPHGRCSLFKPANLHQSLSTFPQHLLLLSQVVAEIALVFFHLVPEALVVNE